MKSICQTHDLKTRFLKNFMFVEHIALVLQSSFYVTSFVSEVNAFTSGKETSKI